MAVLTIPKAIPYEIRKDDHGYQVFAVQRILNAFKFGFTLTEDGDFGSATEDVVKEYQKATRLVQDGVVGGGTQKRFVRSIELRLDFSDLPEGIVPSVVEGESGNLVAAVNWAVSGGVDCGYTQRRVLEADFDNDTVVRRAFDGFYQVSLLADQLHARYVSYRDKDAIVGRADREIYAWRLAVLYHNWPYGADRLGNGFTLSTQKATWVPENTKFDDGAPVVTYRDWAAYYSMGSKAHNHQGRMVKYTHFGVPTYG